MMKAIMFWKLSLPMEPLIFTFYFTVEGYNMYVTTELFPNRDMQGPPRVNTFLNLFNH